VAQLENLARREIANLGVPGWGPQQYTRVIERYGNSLKPKIFFYGICRNDPHDVLVFERWLSDRGYRASLRTFVQRNSVAFNLLRLLWEASDPELGGMQLRHGEIKFDLPALKKTLHEDSQNTRSGWPLIEREIESAIEQSQRANARFVLLYFPSKEDAYWELIKRKDHSLASFENKLDALRMKITDFCKMRGVFCLDLTPALRKRAAQGVKLYFSRDSHWNENGNRAVAEELYEFLLAKNLLD
jgi:hypothetical protein